MRKVDETTIGKYAVATYQHESAGTYAVIAWKRTPAGTSELSFHGQPLAFEVDDLATANEAHTQFVEAIRRAVKES